MTVAYTIQSPYYRTPITNGYLDVATFRSLPSYSDDVLYEIASKYENRPDLLANDLYKDSRLWWIFPVRNPSVIKDPVFDFKVGALIYLPSLATIKKELGI